ncbi:hypothetical protein AGMMS49525_14810 [Bacteroidia bacterium]|nr:hypothetical protein AGMMS49525_14810 [Bacteroidia bacterium]
MKYPTRQEYETPVKNLSILVFDNVLKNGIAIKRNAIDLWKDSGGCAIVFKIQVTNNFYALRCWHRDLGNLKNRYNKIDNYLKNKQLSYFADFSYTEQGIQVNGQKYPIVRMKWIAGCDLKKIVEQNKTNRTKLYDVADKFLQMVKTLHQNNISHGDLQHENIRCKDDNLYLIDYDSLFVPGLEAESNYVKGKPGYQHPTINDYKGYFSHNDYFSELVIYLSIMAIAENPSLYNQYSKTNDDGFLFTKKDFENPDLSQVFNQLLKMSSNIQNLTNKLKEFCKAKDINHLQPLENMITNPWGKVGTKTSGPSNTSNSKQTTTSTPDWSKLGTGKSNQPSITQSANWSKVVKTPKYCNQCGKPYKLTNFCPNCGKKQ